MSNNYDFVSAAQTTPNNEFLNSLETLSVDDVVPPHRKKMQSGGVSLFMLSRLAIVLICVAIFVYCVTELSGIVTDYQRGDDLYGDISKEYNSIINGSTDGNVSQIVLSASDSPMASYSHILTNGAPIYKPTAPSFDKVTSAKFQALLALIQDLSSKNGDTFGYIYIPNSQIDYPMVHCANNDFYLKHAFDGHPSAVGAIFVDFRNNKNIENNQNVVIYGHNMFNGSMFCDATKFLEKDYFMNPENKIEITTFDGHYTFEVFSAYATSQYDNYFRTGFSSDEEFVQFCYDREEKSYYHRENISFKPDDLIITLSTCILGNDDGRYAIHAKLIKVEK
ncbi:MAG: class B sortase [Clostridia bacterium]|nr:class B sortase [Clostridia bacterium]